MRLSPYAASATSYRSNGIAPRLHLTNSHSLCPVPMRAICPSRPQYTNTFRTPASRVLPAWIGYCH